MKELDDQIELEERQLHLLQERENGRTFVFEGQDFP